MIRMLYARKLLTKTSRSIQDIAESTGYTDRQNFSTAFKKYFGTTPGCIRKLTLR
jgi:AraC-like DNA-binding protein